MKKIYENTNPLDLAAIKIGLNELVLQENAARSVANLVRAKLPKGAKILVLAGGGNNAADGIAAARMLNGDYDCEILLTTQKLNKNCALQLKIAQNTGVKLNSVATSQIIADAVIDAIFGSGLNRAVASEIEDLIAQINSICALKIAVDMPTAMRFKADFTITMGAAKLALFDDSAKDFVGEIITADLGLSNGVFSGLDGSLQNDFWLDFGDLKLPNRSEQNVNKSDFGHAFIISGEMSGAAQIAAMAALNIGAGKVSVVSDEPIIGFEAQIMQKREISVATAVLIGSGLGAKSVKEDSIKAAQNAASVIDADAFINGIALDFIDNKNAVLTPHPKEFSSLLNMISGDGVSKIDTKTVQENRFNLAREFSLNHASTLVLKGANTIIAQNGVLYIATFGSSALAKGGSGDALAGTVLGLLAQGYSALNAAISGVLIQQKAALNALKRGLNSYALTPSDLLKELKCL